MIFFHLEILLNFKEKEKVCPSRSSSEYGRRSSNESFHLDEQSHVKIDHVKKDFYRQNGFIQYSTSH